MGQHRSTSAQGRRRQAKDRRHQQEGVRAHENGDSGPESGDQAAQRAAPASNQLQAQKASGDAKCDARLSEGGCGVGEQGGGEDGEQSGHHRLARRGRCGPAPEQNRHCRERHDQRIDQHDERHSSSAGVLGNPVSGCHEQGHSDSVGRVGVVEVERVGRHPDGMGSKEVMTDLRHDAGVVAVQLQRRKEHSRSGHRDEHSGSCREPSAWPQLVDRAHGLSITPSAGLPAPRRSACQPGDRLSGRKPILTLPVRRRALPSGAGAGAARARPGRGSPPSAAPSRPLRRAGATATNSAPAATGRSA